MFNAGRVLSIIIVAVQRASRIVENLRAEEKHFDSCMVGSFSLSLYLIYHSLVGDEIYDMHVDS